MDSNHHRTGTIPIPSDRLKVRHPYIFLSAWCVTTNLKALLTDGFLLSVSSRASNAPLRTIKIHRGRLSATSPAHHRMAINHLLHRLDMMCFLALGATQRESMITTQRVVEALICLCIKGFPCTWFFKVWASRSRTYGEHYLFGLKTYPCLPYIYGVMLCGLSENIHYHYRPNHRCYRQQQCQSEVRHLLLSPAIEERYSYQFHHHLAS